MLRNYCTIIFRNLRKNRFYTIVNIISLALGIASIVWGFQTYRYSYSFNNFHKNSENIFRVLTKVAGNDNQKGYCPEYLARMAINDFPTVKEAVRWDSRGLNVKADQSDPFETQAHFTDPQFFEFFNFPVVRGAIRLSDRSTVVITEKAAKKYFGDRDPIGKTLIFYSDEPFKMPLKVTGILKDPPMNSSFQFELITNTDNQLKTDGSIIKNDSWEWFSDAVFLRLSNPEEAPGLARSFAKYVPLQQSARQDIQLKSFSLDPFSNVFNEVDLDNNSLYRRPSDSATYGPLVLAILILLSACLNFANTSVAQSKRRLKEMGVRKVMGSSLGQIMLQQLMECAVIVFLAICLCMLLNNFWIPTFNSMFRGAVLMAATSMFALVSLNVLKRSKEIAIRKVVGAEDMHIFRLVMKEYTWILFLSAIIGCYGGFALSKLLMDLIFRINAGVSSSSLAISFIGVLLICGTTIGARVWIVLRSKTTDALKAN